MSEFTKMEKLEDDLKGLSFNGTSNIETTDVLESGTIVVDDVDKCREITSRLVKEGKEIAVDFEGIDLCRDGELCLIQCAQKDDNGRVYLFDIVAMNKAAFTEGGLKELLESSHVKKVIYDGRGDADALYHQFEVSLLNVYDLQICSVKRQETLECRPDKFVHGLGKAMNRFLEHDFHRSVDIQHVKKAGKELFAPEKGGSYEVWKVRPLHPDLIKYASLDVEILHDMKSAWERFSPELDNGILAAKRIHKCVHARNAASGRHMAKKDF